MRILIDLYHKDYELWRYPLEVFSELKEEFPSVEFSYIKNKNKYLESLPHADAIIGWRLREVDFPHAEKLRWYHTMAAGIGSMFYKSFIESDIILTNSAGVRAAPMADCIMAYIITFARRFLLLANAQRKKLWVRYEYWREIHKVIDLDSAVVGIIGLGGIGREVAKRSKACGMKVLGVKRNVDIQIDNVDAVYPESPGRFAAPGVPRGSGGLNKYDVIIFVNCSPADLRIAIDDLRGFLSEGKAMLYIAGSDFNSEIRRFGGLLPFEIQNVSTAEGEFFFEPVIRYRQHAAISLSENPDESEVYWNSLPPLSAIANCPP